MSEHMIVDDIEIGDRPERELSQPPCKVTQSGNALYRKIVELHPEIAYKEWGLRCIIEAHLAPKDTYKGLDRACVAAKARDIISGAYDCGHD